MPFRVPSVMAESSLRGRISSNDPNRVSTLEEMASIAAEILGSSSSVGIELGVVNLTLRARSVRIS